MLGGLETLDKISSEDEDFNKTSKTNNAHV
jgi:hypothetical protein